MGGLGSYLLVCVVLSFLQLHPSAQFARAHSVSTLGKLLLDFFRYYGQDITCLQIVLFIHENMPCPGCLDPGLCIDYEKWKTDQTECLYI